MSRNVTADDSIEVEHNGRTLTVPTTFESTELAAWYGAVPDEIRVDRIFVYDGVVRAEQQDSPWVEVGFFTEDDYRPGTETGWVAEKLDIAAGTDTSDGPGETLWLRDDADDTPTLDEIEDAIPDERKNLSFGDEGEGLIDVMEQSEIDAHERGAHDGDHPTCPLCND